MGWIVVMVQWAAILDMIWGITEASRAGVELAIDLDMPQVVAMKACFVKARMIQE